MSKERREQLELLEQMEQVESCLTILEMVPVYNEPVKGRIIA